MGYTVSIGIFRTMQQTKRSKKEELITKNNLLYIIMFYEHDPLNSYEKISITLIRDAVGFSVCKKWNQGQRMKFFCKGTASRS